MKTNRITLIVLFSVLVVVLLVYFIFFDSGEKRYQWFENYKAGNNQPYGTLFIRKMLETYHPEGRFIFNDRTRLRDLLDSVKKDRPTDYVFIGESLHLSTSDAEALKAFISAGNNAFISSLEPNNELMGWIFNSAECNTVFAFKTEKAETATLNFYHDTLRTDKGHRFTYRFGNKDTDYYWMWLNPDIFCDSTHAIVPLGNITPGGVNFVKMPYGSGNLYIHATPIAFTNYFMTKPDNVAYASGVFSHLKGQDIIWDEYSKTPFRRDDDEYDSPLYYIMQQPSLKYAWWMMLATVLLYIFFAARRTQRVIPVLEPKANTSLEFVKLISSLHFQNSNHLDIARKKMKYFLYFIRARYGIQAQHSREEQIRRLAEKSKVNEQQIRAIFEQYDVIERHAHYNTTQDRLVDLYYSIEYFYKHCK